MTNFDQALAVILRHEGGYVDHPDDPGGATNLGITHKTLAAWRGRPVTKAEVRALTRAEAAQIYRANYWNAVNGDSLPPGVDLVVFDMAVNAGVSRASKMLQRLVYVEDDGHIGPMTLSAVARMGAAALINGYSSARMDHYRSLHHWNKFGKGWTRRTEETRAQALDMAKTGYIAPADQQPLTLWASFITRLKAWARSGFSKPF